MARGAAIKYGFVEGPGHGRSYKLKASQHFHRRGGKFVMVDAAGFINVATQISSELLGWAETGKDTAGKSYWKGSTTDGADKVFVVYGLENRFEMPVDGLTGSANATMVGKGGYAGTACNNSTNLQMFVYQATEASCCLTVYDYDSDNQTVVVGIRPVRANVANSDG